VELIGAAGLVGTCRCTVQPTAYSLEAVERHTSRMLIRFGHRMLVMTLSSISVLQAFVSLLSVK